MLFACNGVFDAIVGGYYGKNNLFCVHFCANVHSNKVENNGEGDRKRCLLGGILVVLCIYLRIF